MVLTQRLDDSLRRLGVGGRVGAASSGGADSTALVHLLTRLEGAPEVAVLHVDHGLRPGSHEDARFVEETAGALGLKCRVIHAEVERKPRASLEAAAREARYAALEGAASELGLDWVATAHTLDDQAETVLLRMTRGGALGGIAPVRGRFVRPLLDVRRAELRDWLRAEGIDWREDPTNADLSIERNWVRAVLIPLLSERREGVPRVLARLADAQREDEEVLDAFASGVFARLSSDRTGVFAPAPELDALPPAVTRRVIRAALRRVGTDPTWTDLDAVGALRPGASVRSGQVTVWRLPEGLAFVRESPAVPEPVELPGDGVAEIPDWGLRVRVGPAEAEPWRWRSPIPEGVDNLTLRSRRTGDRVRTRVGTRKVQDVLVDAKVPRPLRDFVPIVAASAGALAVVGLTSHPDPAPLVVDAEPKGTTWSKSAPWTPARR